MTTWGNGQGGARGFRVVLTCCEFISNLRTTLMAASSHWPVLSRARYTLLKAPSPIFSSSVHRSRPGYLGSLPFASRSSATMRSSTCGSTPAFFAAACFFWLSATARAAWSPACAAMWRLSPAPAPTEKSPWGAAWCWSGLWSIAGSEMPWCTGSGCWLYR